jgi:hypothetical protein
MIQTKEREKLGRRHLRGALIDLSRTSVGFTDVE